MGNKTTYMQWRVNTPALLQEILTNPGTGILTKPIQIFARLLSEVGDRASELNDPKLNALMARLALYEQADPYSESYDAKLTEATIRKGYKKPRTQKNKTDAQK